MKGIAQIEKRNFDYRIKYKSNDEFRDLSKAFNEMTNEVNKLIKQKEKLIIQLSHDLKHPLGPLINLIPMLEKKEKNPEKKEMLQIIQRNVDYMYNLVEKTLEFIKLNLPDLKVNLSSIDLYEEISNIIENKKFLFNNKNVVIENNIKKEIFVKVDKILFEELISNIVDNSVKYSGDYLKIIIDAVEKNDQIHVSFKDNGFGMTQIQIEKIFDEFYKTDETRHDFKSTGLGLSISKRIVHKLGGSIWVESPGIQKGTTVYFSLQKTNEIENNIS
jgi:signal transduction histidine kinase